MREKKKILWWVNEKKRGSQCNINTIAFHFLFQIYLTYFNLKNVLTITAAGKNTKPHVCLSLLLFSLMWLFFYIKAVCSETILSLADLPSLGISGVNHVNTSRLQQPLCRTAVAIHPANTTKESMKLVYLI